MPAYHYRAVHGSGRVTRGVATAVNENELAQFLGQSQLELIEAKEKKEETKSGRVIGGLQRKISQCALALFCAQTADLLRAGMPLLEAITGLADMMEEGVLHDALQDVARALRHGSRIAEAFQRQPKVFPKVFTAILAAGEASGDMTHAFEQLARYTESRAKLNERIVRALRYPIFLLCVAFGVVSFMMVLVVPQIVSFLNSIDSQLPPLTKILIAVSEFFGKIWWMAALAVPGFVLLTYIMHRTSSRAAVILDGWLLKLPVVGKVMQKLMLARFAQSFAILVQSGLNIPESLKGARETLGNRALVVKLNDSLQQITSGRELSAALESLFPPFAMRLLRVGEQSGRLSKSLGDIAAHYDREAAESVDSMIGSLEPMLTLFIGGILAWVVLAVLGPIYGSLSHMNMGQ